MAGSLKERLVARALEEGFVACRLCRPGDVPQVAARLRDFVDRGRHGQMGWMAERMAWRGDPAALWPEARTVIMLAESYAPEHDPRTVLARRDRGAISVYAQNRDYHDIVKKRLKRLARWLIEAAGKERGRVPRSAHPADTPAARENPAASVEGAGDDRGRVPLSAHPADTPAAHASTFTSVEGAGDDRDRVPLSAHPADTPAAHANTFTSVEVKVFVDTAPVAEKPLGQAAGLGWQGKHTNLLSRDWGNWAFLGAIFTTLDLPPDMAESDHCGTCRACLDACPTDAFPAPYQLDARRCISYLTIEHKGPVDADLRPALGNRIYGCDDCLAACPWNKFAVAASDIRYAARDDLRAPRLADLAALDDAGFRTLFSGSPVKRIGRDRFVRNVCYAIGNSGDPALRPAVEALTGDADPAVADAARWASLRLQK